MPATKPYFPPEDVAQIQRDLATILASGMLTLGEFTRRFEEEYARLVGVRHALAVSSGTSALEIALRSVNLQPGDEVIVPTNTFTATVASILFAGGKPVMVDVNPETMCIDLANVKRSMSPRTRAVVVVHIAGIVCPDSLEIRQLCDDTGIFMVEDAAHSQGSEIAGRHAGAIGTAGCFSFYPTKVITTGEGGMVTTEDAKIAKKVAILRDQGKESFESNNIIEVGSNWRMDEVSAAIGLVQLKRLPEIIERRNALARIYDSKLLRSDRIKPVKIPPNVRSNYYKYVALLEPGINRDEFKARLRGAGVRCGGEVYWPPCHMQPVYRRLLGTKKGDFPVAEDVTQRMVCLPMFTQLSASEADFVAETVVDVLGEF